MFEIFPNKSKPPKTNAPRSCVKKSEGPGFRIWGRGRRTICKDPSADFYGFKTAVPPTPVRVSHLTPDYARAYLYCKRFNVHVRTVSFLIGIHVINRVSDILIDGATCYVVVRAFARERRRAPTVHVALFSIPKRRSVTNGHHSTSAGDEIGKMKWILCGVLMIGFLFCGNIRPEIIVCPLTRARRLNTYSYICFRWGDGT